MSNQKKSDTYLPKNCVVILGGDCSSISMGDTKDWIVHEVGNTLSRLKSSGVDIALYIQNDEYKKVSSLFQGLQRIVAHSMNNCNDFIGKRTSVKQVAILNTDATLFDHNLYIDIDYLSLNFDCCIVIHSKKTEYDDQIISSFCKRNKHILIVNAHKRKLDWVVDAAEKKKLAKKYDDTKRYSKLTI